MTDLAWPHGGEAVPERGLRHGGEPDHVTVTPERGEPLTVHLPGAEALTRQWKGQGTALKGARGQAPAGSAWTVSWVTGRPQ